MKQFVIYEGTLFECQMIVNLLELEGIYALLRDQFEGTRGGNIYRSAGGVKVVIGEVDLEKALPIVEDSIDQLKNLLNDR